MYKKCWLKLTGSKFAVDTDRPEDLVLHENLLFPLGPEFMTQSAHGCRHVIEGCMNSPLMNKHIYVLVHMGESVHCYM